jgi:hypothetical protein
VAERTLGLVLMNTRPRIAWAPDYPWGMPREDYERYLTQIESSWGTRAFAEQEAAPGDASALFRMFYDSDVREVLGTIRVPALVLSRGGEMEAEARAFASLIPGARQETMPGTALTVMQESAVGTS